MILGSKLEPVAETLYNNRCFKSLPVIFSTALMIIFFAFSFVCIVISFSVKDDYNVVTLAVGSLMLFIIALIFNRAFHLMIRYKIINELQPKQNEQNNND